MTTVHSNVPSRRSSPYSTGGVPESEIDLSTRGPVLLFLGAAIFWLIAASLLGLIVSVKSHWPDFLAGTEALTFGRVQAAFETAFLYGWASNIAFGVGLWLMARLSQNRLVYGALLIVAGVFWNIGVLIALGGIHAGELTGFSSLQLPGISVPMLLIAYAMVGAWVVYTFYARRYQSTYVSQWYLLSAFFWFPWILTISYVMLVAAPVRGTVQSIVNAWYGANILLLWLAPVALAAIYYFVPKVLGRPIRYYYLASIGFWSFAFIAPWIGVARLTSGPVPAWISSSGIVAAVMFLIPLAILGLNILGTFSGADRPARSATFSFIRVGAVVFILVFLVTAVVVFRNFQEVIQFTHFNTAMWLLTGYAFFSMTVFGAIYFLLPRILVREWTSPTLTSIHFWCSLAGVLLIAGSLAIGGWIQGTQINDPSVPFIDVVRATLPWLVGASLGWIVLLIGHVAFAWNVIALILSQSVSEASRATLSTNPPAMKVRVQTT
jgi:cytochrome c oxidase cbb3-type subunit I